MIAEQEWSFGEWHVAVVVVSSGVYMCVLWGRENGREDLIITSLWATGWLEDVQVKQIGSSNRHLGVKL